MGVLGKRRMSIDEEDVEDEEELNTTGDVSESDSESESDDDEDDVELAEPSKTAIYNKEGILEKLSEIAWPNKVDWMHTLTIVIDQEQEVNVNDDLAREAAFYTQAVQAVREALPKLEAKGKPFLRPSDYYAEMVKSDAHMEKVKKRLLVEKQLLEEQELRKKDRESKKISKQVQAEKQKERAKEKKENIDSVKKWRKQRERSGYADDKDEMGLSFEDGTAFQRKGKKQTGVSPGDRSGGKAKQFGGKIKKGGKNRESKDSKFGFGGRKGNKKQNTADSTSDLRGFNNNSGSAKKRRKLS